MIVYDFTVNHHPYLERLTRKGTIAWMKRPSERVEVEIELYMSRLTNFFNPSVGYEVPPLFWNGAKVQGGLVYVVTGLLNQPKQPDVSNILEGEDSKYSMRRNVTEFGISRNTKVWGRRRVHSTTVLNSGKGPSLVPLGKGLLSGNLETKELSKLRKDIKSKNTINNLSLIMSDPNFLLGCWIRIRSKPGSSTKALGSKTLDALNEDWFISVANSFRNGKFKFSPARRTYIPKPNGKKRPLTMPSPRDKIVQEAMRFLLELIYEPTFRSCNNGWRSNRSCGSALSIINRTFGGDNWYIEGDIEQMFPSMDHKIIVEMLSEKIKDQAFIDLIYKYLKVGYDEEGKEIVLMPLGVIQGGLISPILANIYMTRFDNWVMDELIPSFNKGKRKKSNPDYTKMIREGKATNKKIMSTIDKDENFKRMHYVRYADDFLIGINGSYEDCIMIRKKLKTFLEEKLKLTMNLDKTKITHATKEAAVFLGYRIHKTKIGSMAIKYNKKGVLTRRTGRVVLDGTINRVVKRLEENGFARRGGIPTRNGKFIHLNLFDLVEHFKSVERGILNYYGLAYNYGRLAARVHYILKYSCVLTIAGKMRLRTRRKVFRKYGKDLKVKSPDGERETSWPKISYNRPRSKRPFVAWNPNLLVDSLTRRLNRGRGDLTGPCLKCGSWANIEVHHVRKLKDINRKDYVGQMMARMKRKQIPLCRDCHVEHHRQD